MHHLGARGQVKVINTCENSYVKRLGPAGCLMVSKSQAFASHRVFRTNHY